MANKIKLAGTTVPEFQVGLRGATISSSAVTAPYSLVLPPTLGTDGQALTLDSTGNLVFSNAGGGSTGDITFQQNKIIGDGSMSLVPDINQEGNDRYLIVEQTNEGLTLRPGGSVDNSAANINIGSPKNRFVASDDDGSARMENNLLTTINNFYLDSSTFSTAQWINGGVAFNDASQTVLDAIWALTTESLIEITDGNQWWTVTYAGSSTPGPGQTNTLFVNENPPVDPTDIYEVDIAIRTLVSAFVEVSSRDVTITAADDLRLTATDVFSLRNTSSTDPITITTDGNSSSHTWNFGEDAILTLPQDGDIVDSNGISIIGRDVNYATTSGSTNYVDLVNVGGAGNIASLNLNGNSAQILAGDGTWIAQPSQIANGTSSINIASIGNTVMTVSGNAVMTASGTRVTFLEDIQFNGYMAAGNFEMVSGNIFGNVKVSGVSTLGNVGNVKITGGTSGQFLQTNGSGNLSWVTPTTGRWNNLGAPTSGTTTVNSIGGVSWDSMMKPIAGGGLGVAEIKLSVIETANSSIVGTALMEYNDFPAAGGNIALKVYKYNTNTLIGNFYIANTSLNTASLSGSSGYNARVTFR